MEQRNTQKRCRSDHVNETHPTRRFDNACSIDGWFSPRRYVMGKGDNVKITLAEMVDSDWPAVAAIYQEGIDTGHATFVSSVPTWEQFDNRHLSDGRLVARLGDSIVGWVGLSGVSNRCVYAGVAEMSIYVKAAARGHGIGYHLLTKAIEASEQAGFWTLQAGIFPENAASLALHKRCGFRLVGYRERLGKMNGLWRDVALMERRSAVAGV